MAGWLSLLAVALVATGCGNGGGNTASPASSEGASASGAEPVVIKVWTLDRHDQDYMNEMINKFNQEHEGQIKVEYQIYADNYNQTLNLAFATNEAPDIFFDGGTAWADLMPKGDIAPLDPYLTDEDKSRFGEGAFVEGINMVDGKIYSLPAIGTTPRLIYNKDVFEKAGISAPPASLDEMVKDAKQISDKLKGQGVYGFSANMKSPTSALSRSIDYILMRSGGVKAGFDFKAGKYDFSGYKPILEAYRQIFTSDAAFPGSESLDIDPLRTQFAAGKIGMYISWTHSEPGVYLNQFPTQQRWDVAQLPTIDGTVKGSQDVLLAGRWFFMNAHTPHPDQAWEVMKYLYSDELLSGYYTQGLGMVRVPSALKSAAKPETVTKWPNLEFTDKDKVWPAIPLGVNPEGNIMYDEFAQVIFGQLDADKAIQDLNQRYNAAYQQAISQGKTKPIQYPDFDPADPAKSLQ